MLTTMIVTAIGIFGAGAGAWIAALFVPPFALFLKSLLDFARSPFGMVLGFALSHFVAFSSGYVGGDIHGAHEVRAEWQADKLASTARARARETAVAKAAQAEADLTINALAAHAETLQEKVNAYADSRKGDRSLYPATRNDVRRLLDIK